MASQSVQICFKIRMSFFCEIYVNKSINLTKIYYITYIKIIMNMVNINQNTNVNIMPLILPFIT